MLIFGLILLLSATSLLNLVSEKKQMSDRQQAYQLSGNLAETLLALPLDEAKALDPSQQSKWTAHNRYQVKLQWTPYPKHTDFEKVEVSYAKGALNLIHLSLLHSKN